MKLYDNSMVNQMDNKEIMSLKHDHEQVLVNSELYKLLVDSVQDYAIFLMDPEGYIQTWNKGARSLKGYKAAEIIGKNFSIFYLQKDKDKKKPEIELQRARENGRVEDEGWRVRQDGTKFWANVVVTALYGPNGEFIGFAKVTRDLSERKKQEEKLKKANALLKKQRHELQSLNVSKDEFISLASHQLRTPATGVKQYVGMVREGFTGEINPKQKELLDRAHESNERQLRIISDLLKVAQVDAGKVKPHPVLTNINELLTSVIREQSSAYELRRQKIKHIDPEDAVIAKVDGNLIRMVLENIISNASKYSYHDSVVTVRAYKEKGVVRVDVEDNGVGVREDDIPRLFHKFSRVDNELSTEVGGSGLGLYWAKKIVDLHGGKIFLHSEANKGSIFSVELPQL